MDEKIRKAAEEYISRRDRMSHPSGRQDNGGRWYPSDDERCSCCNSVRSPSRSWPWSYMTHCRTINHVANLYGVPVADVRRAVREIEPPTREGGESYFKAVARTEDGRLVSIFAGNEIEYRLGQEMHETAHRGHTGGYYVYATPELAAKAVVPEESKAMDLPRVIVRCAVSGQYCRYGEKLAFSHLTPLEIVA